MTNALDGELRAAFETATEFVQPPPDMADLVRRAARQRRRRLTASLAAATAVVVIVAGGFLATRDSHQPAPSGPPVIRHRGFSIPFPDGYTALQLAVSGPYLYALIGPPDGDGFTLAAYDRGTGQLVHQVSVPGAGGTALAVGPGGLVWLSFTAGTASGPTGTWLLSPDLRVHSSGSGAAGAYILLPVSRTTALIPGQYGLTLIRMPMPGSPGRGTEHLEQGTSLGPPPNTAPGVSAAMLDGRVVVQVTNGYGFHSHLVIAGQPGTTFGGRGADLAGYFASTGSSLWVATYAVHGQNATAFGQLVRVDSRLQPTTPEAILDNPILARTVRVWATGTTVWAATAARDHALVCFAAGSQLGLLTTLAVDGPVTAFAASGGTAYITTTIPDGASGTVFSYPIPAACR